MGTRKSKGIVIIELYFKEYCVYGYYLILLLTRLESAYLLIRGAHEIWEQSLDTFMKSRPI